MNGCGQAFGHEGYGWIKRHLHGRLLSYVCGDASRAYRPVTDGQFKDLLEKNGIPQNTASGFGDSGLKKYERHLVFVRPDIVVVYDVLQAEKSFGVDYAAPYGRKKVRWLIRWLCS